MLVKSKNDAEYDSDGEKGPLFDAVQGECGLEGKEEEEIVVENDDLTVAEVVTKNNDRVPILKRLGTLKVTESTTELQRRACSVRERKVELFARLRKAVDKNLPWIEDIASEVQANLAGDGFAFGAKWESQEPTNEEVEDEAQRVINAISFREPTVGVVDIMQGVKFQRIEIMGY